MVSKQLNHDFLEARRARDSISSNVLGVIISELRKLEKDRPDKPVTDEDCFRIIRKMIESNREILGVAPNNEKATTENILLEGYLPKMMTESELRAAISDLKANGATDMKGIMAGLKSGFAGRYDGKLASTIAKESLS